MATLEVELSQTMERPAGEPGTGFGLYVHWPFCQAKCPYCDFNSHVVAQIDQTRWANALAADIARVSAETSDRILTSVFVGGGTPSTMSVGTVQSVMNAIRSGWTCAPDLEVSMEANPTSVDASRFAGYRDAGVTRLSLGVQALNDIDLRRLGRLHTADEAKAAFDVARSTFDRVSFDLICARQDQSREAWARELDDALSMAIDHISLYQLTIEPGTAFADRAARGGLKGLPDEDLGADLYEITIERCQAAGLNPYEISNFARPGAECRHNELYWSGGDYAGVGPGAHGRLTFGEVRYATEQVLKPGEWLRDVVDGKHEERRQLSPREQIDEYIMMGLRKTSGLDMGFIESKFPDEGLATNRIDALIKLDLLSAEDERLKATAQGRLLLNQIVMELLTED